MQQWICMTAHLDSVPVFATFRKTGIETTLLARGNGSPNREGAGRGMRCGRCQKKCRGLSSGGRRGGGHRARDGRGRAGVVVVTRGCG